MSDPSSTTSRDLQRVLDAVIDGVIVVAPGGSVDRINHEACRMLETSEDSHLGRSLAELVDQAHPMLVLADEVFERLGPITSRNDDISGR